MLSLAQKMFDFKKTIQYKQEFYKFLMQVYIRMYVYCKAWLLGAHGC